MISQKLTISNRHKKENSNVNPENESCIDSLSLNLHQFILYFFTKLDLGCISWNFTSTIAWLIVTLQWITFISDVHVDYDFQTKVSSVIFSICKFFVLFPGSSIIQWYISTGLITFFSLFSVLSIALNYIFKWKWFFIIVYYAFYWSPVFYMPLVFPHLRMIFGCVYSPFNSNITHPYFSSVTCWTDSHFQYLFPSIFFFLWVTWIVYLVIILLKPVQFSIKSENNNMFYVFDNAPFIYNYVGCIIMCTLHTAALKSGWSVPVAFVFTLIGIGSVILNLKHMPYTFDFPMALSVFQAFIIFWTGFISVLMTQIKDNEGLGLLYFIAFPIFFVLSYVLVTSRYHSVSLYNEQEMNSPDTITLALKTCIRNYAKTVMDRTDYIEPTEYLAIKSACVDKMNDIIVIGLNRFSNSYKVRAISALFYSEVVMNRLLCYNEIDSTLALHPPLEYTHLVTRLKSSIDVASLAEQSKDVKDYLDFKFYHHTMSGLLLSCLKNLSQMWGELLRPEPDIDIVSNLGYVGQQELQKVLFLFEKLLEINSSNVALLRLYGIILLDIVGDPKQADKHFDLANDLLSIHQKRNLEYGNSDFLKNIPVALDIFNDTLPICQIDVSRLGQIEFANPQFLKLSGLTEAQILEDTSDIIQISGSRQETSTGRNINHIIPSPVKEVHKLILSAYNQVKNKTTSSFINQSMMVTIVNAHGYLETMIVYNRWADEVRGKLISVMDFVDTSNEVCCWLDSDFKVTNTSNTLHSILGISKRSILNSLVSLYDIIPGFVEHADDIDSSGNNDNIIYLLLSPSGYKYTINHHLTNHMYRITAYLTPYKITVAQNESGTRIFRDKEAKIDVKESQYKNEYRKYQYGADVEEEVEVGWYFFYCSCVKVDEKEESIGVPSPTETGANASPSSPFSELKKPEVETKTKHPKPSQSKIKSSSKTKSSNHQRNSDKMKNVDDQFKVAPIHSLLSQDDSTLNLNAQVLSPKTPNEVYDSTSSDSDSDSDSRSDTDIVHSLNRDTVLSSQSRTSSDSINPAQPLLSSQTPELVRSSAFENSTDPATPTASLNNPIPVLDPLNINSDPSGIQDGTTNSRSIGSTIALLSPSVDHDNSVVVGGSIDIGNGCLLQDNIENIHIKYQPTSVSVDNTPNTTPETSINQSTSSIYLKSQVYSKHVRESDSMDDDIFDHLLDTQSQDSDFMSSKDPHVSDIEMKNRLKRDKKSRKSLHSLKNDNTAFESVVDDDDEEDQSRESYSDDEDGEHQTDDNIDYNDESFKKQMDMFQKQVRRLYSRLQLAIHHDNSKMFQWLSFLSIAPFVLLGICILFMLVYYGISYSNLKQIDYISHQLHLATIHEYYLVYALFNYRKYQILFDIQLKGDISEMTFIYELYKFNRTTGYADLLEDARSRALLYIDVFNEYAHEMNIYSLKDDSLRDLFYTYDFPIHLLVNGYHVVLDNAFQEASYTYVTCLYYCLHEASIGNSIPMDSIFYSYLFLNTFTGSYSGKSNLHIERLLELFKQKLQMLSTVGIVALVLSVILCLLTVLLLVIPVIIRVEINKLNVIILFTSIPLQVRRDIKNKITGIYSIITRSSSNSNSSGASSHSTIMHGSMLSSSLSRYSIGDSMNKSDLDDFIMYDDDDDPYSQFSNTLTTSEYYTEDESGVSYHDQYNSNLSSVSFSNASHYSTTSQNSTYSGFSTNSYTKNSAERMFERYTRAVEMRHKANIRQMRDFNHLNDDVVLVDENDELTDERAHKKKLDFSNSVSFSKLKSVLATNSSKNSLIRYALFFSFVVIYFSCITWYSGVITATLDHKANVIVKADRRSVSFVTAAMTAHESILTIPVDKTTDPLNPFGYVTQPFYVTGTWVLGEVIDAHIFVSYAQMSQGYPLTEEQTNLLYNSICDVDYDRLIDRVSIAENYAFGWPRCRVVLDGLFNTSGLDATYSELISLLTAANDVKYVGALAHKIGYPQISFLNPIDENMIFETYQKIHIFVANIFNVILLYSNALYVDEFDEYVHRYEQILLVILIIGLATSIILYFVVFYPLNKILSDRVKLTTSLLLLLPPEVLQYVKEIKNYIDEHTTNHN